MIMEVMFLPKNSQYSM